MEFPRFPSFHYEERPGNRRKLFFEAPRVGRSALKVSTADTFYALDYRGRVFKIERGISHEFGGDRDHSTAVRYAPFSVAVADFGFDLRTARALFRDGWVWVEPGVDEREGIVYFNRTWASRGGERECRMLVQVDASEGSPTAHIFSTATRVVDTDSAINVALDGGLDLSCSDRGGRYVCRATFKPRYRRLKRLCKDLVLNYLAGFSTRCERDRGRVSVTFEVNPGKFTSYEEMYNYLRARIAAAAVKDRDVVTEVFKDYIPLERVGDVLGWSARPYSDVGVEVEIQFENLSASLDDVNSVLKNCAKNSYR